MIVGRGEPLPSLGDRVAKDTKANAEGVQLPRPGIRVIGKSNFDPNLDLPALMNALFGPVTTAVAASSSQFDPVCQTDCDKLTDKADARLVRTDSCHAAETY